MDTSTIDSAAELNIGSTRTRILVSSQTTHGAYCMMHQVVVPGLVTPTHRHTHEDQVAMVLEGRLGFWVEGSAELEARAGTVVNRPRGLFHALWNASEEPATMLEITTPAGSFERWMRHLSELNTSGTADEATVRALAAGTYGIEFADADDPGGSRPAGTRRSFWQR